MITLRGGGGIPERVRPAMVQVARGLQNGVIPTGIACTKPKEKCARRYLLVVGDYWPEATPTSLDSDASATAGLTALQTDLGVAADGSWGPVTQRALEAALGIGPIQILCPSCGGGGGKPQGDGGVRPPSVASSTGILVAVAVAGLAAAGAGAYYWLRKRGRRR